MDALRVPVRSALALLLLALLGAAPAAAQPRATAADLQFGPLARVGVSASGATLAGRALTVRIRLRQKAGIRLSVVDRDDIRGYTKRVLAPGSYVFHGQLTRTPTGRNLQLRITARLLDGRRGRQRYKLAVASNSPPTAIGLSGTSVAENQPAGTVVGLLTATDADPTDAHVFSLVGGDAGAFAITGATLRTAAAFDFETKPTYTIRVRVVDGHGGTFERTFVIAVTNANDAPVALALHGASVAENQPAGTTVGSLTATDPDGDPLAFALVGGDLGAFALSGATLRTAAPFDYEAKPSYSVRIAVSDGHGGSLAETFTIAVTDVDDAPVLVTSPGTASYIENDPPTVVDGSLTVTDADDATLAGATVQLTAGLHAGDTLAFTAQAGITGAYDPATGLLTLTGTQTLAQYEAALRSVEFASTSDAPGTTRTVSFTVDDGRLGSAPATRSLSVTPVNDAPSIATSAGPVGYTEADPATPIDPGLQLSDPDSQITGATVQLAGALAEDVLALPAQPNVTGSYDGATGTLTLTGTASVADYQAALRAVTYRDSSKNPSTVGRTATFVAVDDAAAASAPATRAIAVSPVDNAPDVTTSSGALAYTENDPATPIDTGLTIADPDSIDLTGATVQITGGYAAGEDVLSLPAQPVVTAVFDPATGRLTLSGTATLAAYETALQAVAYADTSDDPSVLARTVTFAARDADGFGLSAAHGITVAAVDDPPVAVADAVTFAEDAGASQVDVLANDTDVDGGPKSVASVSGGAFGAAAVAGGVVSYTPDANYCGPDSFTYTLGGGSTATVAVTVTCVDDPPVAVADSATVVEDAAAAAIDVLANDTDIDGGPKTVIAASTPAHGVVVVTAGGLTYQPDPNYCGSDSFDYKLNGLSSATVSVTVSCVDDPPVAVDDSLTVLEDAGATAVDVLGNDTDIDGGPKAVGAVTQPPHGTATLNAGVVSYQPAADYCGPDSFTYTLNGGSTAVVSLAVTCQPDAPVLVTSAAPVGFIENDPATPVDPAVGVTDADADAQIVGATAQITANYAGAEDVLALAGSHPGIAAAVAGSTLTLTGSATPAAYEAALRDVTYRDTSDDPSALTRTVTFTVTDETALTGSGARAVVVTPVDDPPVAVDDSATVLEDSGTTAVAVLANDTDVDGGTKTIQSVTQPAHGTVAITGLGSGLTYTPAGNYCNDTAPFDTFTYKLLGGTGSATVSMTVTCVNDAPVAVDDAFTGAQSAVGNTALAVDAPGDGPPAVSGPSKSITGNILGNDTDVDGPNALAVVPGTLTSNDGGTVVMQSDGDFVFTPAPGCTDTADFFLYTVTDGAGGTDVGRVDITISGCVWYVSNNAPGNAGTSTAPFDTLGEAQTAAGTSAYIFVFDGDGTAYAGGIGLKDNQRLIGEAADLKVGGDTLSTGDPAKRPTLTASNADVVGLASGNTVRGIAIDPSGTGEGIAGGAGDAGGTIDDVRIVDAGTPGTQPALGLNGTTGTFNVSGLEIDAPVGVLLNNAGTVDFGSTSITATGGRALDATNTNMGTSTFDAVTVSGSSSGGVRMSGTTGSTTFGDGVGTDLSLTTTGGAVPAFQLNNAGSVTVPAGGTANVSATGGPAIDVVATPGASLAFDDVSSSGSTGDAINLDGLGNGTFGASSGMLSGFAGVAFDLNGGSGSVGYGGAIGDGAGSTADITGRTGGAVTLSGSIADGADAGGGITLSGDSGGSTTFSGASKVLNTGAAGAVAMSSSDGHTLTFSGGGLGITTTSGKGLDASASGTLAVSGTGNTIDTGTGRALGVVATDIGAGGVTFQHVSSDGASNGILLNGTGSGRLVVSGTGGTCTAADQSGCSGGQIRNSAGADDSGTTPVGTGVVLKDTVAPSLTRVWIHDDGNYAIRGTNVSGLTLDHSVINGVNGNDGTTPFDDSSVWIDNLTGSAAVSDTFVSGGFEDNFRVVNTAGSLNRITFTNATFGISGSTPGNDAVLLETAASAGQLQATVQNSTFQSAGGDLLQFDHNGAGAGDLVLTGNAFSNGNPTIATGGGGLSLFQGGTAGGNTTMTIDGNTFRDAVGPAVLAVKSIGPATQTGTFTNNSIGVVSPGNSGSAEGSALKLQSVDQGTASWTVSGNTIRGYNNFGVEVLAGGGSTPQSGTINTTITGNTITAPGNTVGTLGIAKQGIHFNIGTVPGDTLAACAKITGNTIDASGADSVPSTIDVDVRLRQRQSTTIRLPGYAGANNDNAAVQAFVAANNSLGTSVLAGNTVPTGGGFVGGGTTCP